MAIEVHRPWDFMPKGLDFGLGPLEASHYPPAKGSTYYTLLAMYFQPISLDSPQSLATEPRSLSTPTAIV
jgi:hypothetical protein